MTPIDLRVATLLGLLATLVSQASAAPALWLEVDSPATPIRALSDPAAVNATIVVDCAALLSYEQGGVVDRTFAVHLDWTMDGTPGILVGGVHDVGGTNDLCQGGATNATLQTVLYVYVSPETPALTPSAVDFHAWMDAAGPGQPTLHANATLTVQAAPIVSMLGTTEGGKSGARLRDTSLATLALVYKNQGNGPARVVLTATADDARARVDLPSGLLLFPAAHEVKADLVFHAPDGPWKVINVTVTAVATSLQDPTVAGNPSVLRLQFLHETSRETPAATPVVAILLVCAALLRWRW